MAGLSISLLRPVQVLVDGTWSAAFSYNKARALLAYLVVESGHTHQRDTLVGLLWPDLPNDAARANLRQALAYLRQAIGDAVATPPFLHITRETVQFNANSVYALDVAAFRELLAACEAHPHRHIDRCRLCAARLEQAAALYRGDFLAELSLTHSAAFEAWVVMQRERLHQLALDACSTCARSTPRQLASCTAKPPVIVFFKVTLQLPPLAALLIGLSVEAAGAVPAL